jgi:hypothetical protein
MESKVYASQAQARGIIENVMSTNIGSMIKRNRDVD